MGILFEHATILSGAATLIRNGHLLVEDGRIKALGEGALEAGTQAGTQAGATLERVDASGCLLLPAFFNTHTHAPMTLLRNYADDMDLQTWLFTKIFPAEDKLDGDDIAAGTRLAMMEMLAGGTAGFTDMYYFCDRMAQAVSDGGMRALLTRGLMNGAESGPFDQDVRLAENRELFAQWHGAGDGRIRIGFGPHAVYTCSPAYLAAVAEEADRLGATIHVHLDETRREHLECLERHGRTPAKLCDDWGLFRRPAVAAHCVHVTEEDMDLLAERNVTIAHNPRSNLKLASGIAPVARARAKGIRVALGTDGASSNNALDMWGEMGLAALLHKGASLDPLAVAAEEAIHMATRAGAEAMGLGMSGRLEAGMEADLVMADMSGPHWQPLHNPLSALVYSGRASDVRLTMVAGRVLYRDGAYLTIDAERVRHDVARTMAKVFGL